MFACYLNWRTLCIVPARRMCRRRMPSNSSMLRHHTGEWFSHNNWYGIALNDRMRTRNYHKWCHIVFIRESLPWLQTVHIASGVECFCNFAFSAWFFEWINLTHSHFTIAIYFQEIIKPLHLKHIAKKSSIFHCKNFAHTKNYSFSGEIWYKLHICQEIIFRFGLLQNYHRNDGFSEMRSESIALLRFDVTIEPKSRTKFQTMPKCTKKNECRLNAFSDL